MIIIDNFLYNHLLTCRDKIWSKKLWVLPAYCYLPCRHVAYPLAHPAVQHRTGVEVLLLLLYDTAQGQQADNNLQCGLLHSYMLFTSCRATSGKNNDALMEKVATTYQSCGAGSIFVFAPDFWIPVAPAQWHPQEKKCGEERVPGPVLRSRLFLMERKSVKRSRLRPNVLGVLDT